MNKGTVFIVEDDRELVELLRLRLETLGHNVISTENGDEAWNIIQTAHPDLVILDIFLPDTDGLTILKRVKAPIDIETGKPSKTKDIPVIVITGKAPMIENMTRVEGAVDFFVKPFDSNKLVKRITELLEMVQHEREPKP